MVQAQPAPRTKRKNGEQQICARRNHIERAEHENRGVTADDPPSRKPDAEQQKGQQTAKQISAAANRFGTRAIRVKIRFCNSQPYA